MVRIKEDIRKFMIRLSLAGMPNDELLQVYGHIHGRSSEGQMYFEGFDIAEFHPKLKERIEFFLTQDISKRIAHMEKEGVQVLVVGDESYPEKLALTEQPPVVIYAIGNLELMGLPSISVVGARKHTQYGARMCKRFVPQLAEYGIVIISGLALGIDKLAHMEALGVQGETIAVLGNGIGDCYPKSNRDIYEHIKREGLVLSEYPPFTPPKPFRFPERNRIIAALGDGTLVVEAKEKSGSLITARLAAECGREVFAICGDLDSIYSKGTNRLIFDGAQMVLAPEDICEHSIYNGLKKEKKTAEVLELSLEEKTLYDTIKSGSQHIDAIVEATGWDITEVLSVLTMLELKNQIIGVDSDCIEVL